MKRDFERDLDRVAQIPFHSLVEGLLFLLEAEYVEPEEIEASRRSLEHLQNAIESALELKE
jgi:hypothetical protein